MVEVKGGFRWSLLPARHRHECWPELGAATPLADVGQWPIISDHRHAFTCTERQGIPGHEPVNELVELAASIQILDFEFGYPTLISMLIPCMYEWYHLS